MIWDVLIVLIYFSVVLVGGFWSQRRAGKNLESYFLGSRGLPWWALAMSGSASNFSLMGTMWMCTVLFTLGMKSYWIHWFWALPLGISLMSYMAIWIRRTGVMTAAELLRIRFGSGTDAVWARTVFAVMAVLMHAGTLGMAYVASAKFLAVYMERVQSLAAAGAIGPVFGFDLSAINPAAIAEITAVIITILTAAYVLSGGFESVIITDVLQTVLLAIVGVSIGVIGFLKVDHAVMDVNMEGLGAWLSLELPWRTAHASYEAFGPLVMTYTLIGALICLGGAGGHYGEQRFLAARNSADAAKAAALWQWIAVPRWLLIAGIVILAMGAFDNVDDPEKIMPMVLDRFMTVGMRGLVIAGLIAAYMSTVSSLINSGASMMMRDIWQPFFAKDADAKYLVRKSRAATLILVAMSIIIGFISLRLSSIDGLWRWLMAGLGASYIVPNALRWYWWRMNGWGFTTGTIVGFILSALMLVFKDAPQYIMTPVLLTASLAGCIIGSLVTKPVKAEYIDEFYCRVRPFGLWSVVRQRCNVSSENIDVLIKPGRVVLNFVIGTIATYAWYMLPVYLIGHWWTGAAWTGIMALLTTLTLYFTWYKVLPKD
ncbi:MAG: hypothetical protein KAS23_16640 [Anaerohalosphaera sp.]|nr:hypothetical protein [Anaerohalosphaera sp.]